MAGLDVDITTLMAIWMGGLLLLVPLAGLTARYALKPVLDSVAAIRRAGAGAPMDDFELRFARMERQMATLQTTLEDWQRERRSAAERVSAVR